MLHNFHRSLFQQFCFLNNVFFISFNSNTLLTCQLWQPTPRTPLFSLCFRIVKHLHPTPRNIYFFPYSAQKKIYFLFYISVPLKQNNLFFSIPTIDPTVPLPLTMKTNALIDLVHLVQWGGTPCCGPTWKTPYENLARHSSAPARRCGNTAPYLFAIACDLPRLLVPVPGHVSFPRGKKNSIVLDLRLARLDKFHRLFLFFILFLSTARPPYQPWISQPRHAFLAAH